MIELYFSYILAFTGLFGSVFTFMRMKKYEENKDFRAFSTAFFLCVGIAGIYLSKVDWVAL